MSERDNAELIQAIIEERDSRRPSMQLVIAAIDSIFRAMPDLGFVPEARGPDHWTWIDSAEKQKVYCLTRSNSPGAEGYPLLTMRIVCAPRLDSYLTLSQLVVGPSIEEIRTTITNMSVHFTGAHSGMKSTMVINATQGLPEALAHAINISNPAAVSVEQVKSGELLANLLGSNPKPKTELN